MLRPVVQLSSSSMTAHLAALPTAKGLQALNIWMHPVSLDAFHALTKTPVLHPHADPHQLHGEMRSFFGTHPLFGTPEKAAKRYARQAIRYREAYNGTWITARYARKAAKLHYSAAELYLQLKKYQKYGVQMQSLAGVLVLLGKYDFAASVIETVLHKRPSLPEKVQQSLHAKAASNWEQHLAITGNKTVTNYGSFLALQHAVHHLVLASGTPADKSSRLAALATQMADAHLQQTPFSTNFRAQFSRDAEATKLAADALLLSALYSAASDEGNSLLTKAIRTYQLAATKYETANDTEASNALMRKAAKLTDLASKPHASAIRQTAAA